LKFARKSGIWDYDNYPDKNGGMDEMTCLFIQNEDIQHQLGEKFDRLSETAKTGMCCR